MATKLINLEIEEGTDFNYQFQYINPSTELPINITNYTATLEVVDYMGNTVNKFTFTTASGKLLITGTSGIVTLSLVEADTLGTGQFKGHYNLFLTSPATVKEKIAKGFFTIIQSV